MRTIRATRRAAAPEGLRAGAQDYLATDNVTGDLVLRAVRHAIERKRTEGEIARGRWLAAIGESALAVRHEVNNPLAALHLHVELPREHRATTRRCWTPSRTLSGASPTS